MNNNRDENNDDDFGLNLLRFGSVLLVLFGHLMLFRPSVSIISSQLAPLFGFLGVEVLLVLCGFLIGKQVYTLLIAGNSSPNSAIFSFFKRCAWRVLPLYYLVLLLVVLTSRIIGYTDASTWKYFFFIQNFGSAMPIFFPESWSIPIVFFGCVILVFSVRLLVKMLPSISKSTLFFITTVGVLLLSFLCKYLYYLHYGAISLMEWDQNIKSVVIFRLDSFFVGVLCVWVYYTCSSFWINFRKPLSFVGILLMVLLFIGVGYFRFFIDSQAFFWEVLYLPLTSISIALTFPLVYQLRSNSIVIKKLLSFLGKFSLGMFLIHYSIVLLVLDYFMLISQLSAPIFFGFVVIYLTIVIVSSFILHRFFEMPIFRWGTKN
ncbi:MAG: acyltransferase [Flavobacterium sp.]|nr:acyltransferase [Flavobacterium sp.]